MTAANRPQRSAPPLVSVREEDLEALAAEAEANDPPGSSVRFANATPEERPGILRDAATFRVNSRAQIAGLTRALTEDELVILTMTEDLEREREGTPPEPATDWPEPMTEAAYHGVLGEIARAVAPLTEADPVAILGTLLVMFGASCGRNRRLFQGSMQQANLSVLLVGETGFRGRKGTALDIGRAVFRLAYPDLDELWLVGVASGEAITGHLGRKEPEVRVLIVEPEFGRLLTIMNREGSTLSPVLRNAWDGTALGHARARDESLVSAHHVALLGHVTPTELRAKLTEVDTANGFANRILFLAVRRSRPVAFPTAPDAVVAPFVERLHKAIMEAQPPREYAFDDDAHDRWEAFYSELAIRPRLGLAGAVTGRHEAQVARLALVYALADRSSVIGVEHLDAAIAFAEYARRSAVWAFGDSTGNRHADVVARLLREHGEVDRQTVKEETGLRLGADLDAVERVLVDSGLATLEKEPRAGGGRKRRVLRLVANGRNRRNGLGGARKEEEKIVT